MESAKLEMLRQVAAGIADQFGPSCEVVVHDLEGDLDHSIVAIYNGHVSGRRLGDGASNVVFEQIKMHEKDPKDHCGYLTKTDDGKILKSSTIYIRNNERQVDAILAINYDISKLLMAQDAAREFTQPKDVKQKEPEKIVKINELLDNLILQSVKIVGKPVAMMGKEDKIKAIHFLSENGALLVTKSSDKIAKYFGISKFTLYSYIDADSPNKA